MVTFAAPSKADAPGYQLISSGDPVRFTGSLGNLHRLNAHDEEHFAHCFTHIPGAVGLLWETESIPHFDFKGLSTVGCNSAVS